MIGSSLRRRATSSAAALAAALFVVSAPLVAFAQPTTTSPPLDTPSVGVSPTESKPEDPNSGQWFVFRLDAGQVGKTKARVVNPADVEQTVRLYIRDLLFGDDGTPSVNDGEQTDIGAWGKVSVETFTLPPRQETLVEFSVTVPPNAEPGDHVGVLVAENSPVGTNIQVIRRVATRLYVTVPGEATKDFKIDSLTKSLDSTFVPKAVRTKIILRNTGRIRVSPIVNVSGTKAKGPEVMLSQSVEEYHADVKVPFYGGPVKVDIEVVADGIVRRATTSVFVIPWPLIIGIVVVVLLVLGIRWIVRRRSGRMRRLHEDIRRLEQLVAERPSAARVNLPEPAPGAKAEDLEARRASIEGALKRARRTGSQGSLELLGLALHEEGGDALDVLLEALAEPSPQRRSDLVAAVVSYDRADVLDHARLGALPADVVAEIEARFPAKAPRTGKSR